MAEDVPRIPASAGALIRNTRGRLLILKPTYKKGWTIPGGQVDADGESPWEACRRETREECGLTVSSGRLVCIDFRKARPQRPGGVRFLFECGTLEDSALSAIRLDEDEIDAYRFAKPDDALTLLSAPLRRRISQSIDKAGCIYLEEGRPVPGFSN